MEGLRRLNRPDTQKDQDLTAEFVEAGVELIEEALDHDPNDGKGHPFLAWISQRRVVERVNHRGRLRTTVSALRDHWGRHSDYLRDLIDHVRSRRVTRSFPVRAGDVIDVNLSSQSAPSQLVRSVASELEQGIFESDFFRLQLVALAVVGSPGYRRADDEADAADIYRDTDARWEPIFETFLAKWDLVPRVGISVADMVEATTAISEGLGLRELADPTSGSSREARLRLHGSVLLALVLALTESSQQAESNSIDKAVDQAVT